MSKLNGKAAIFAICATMACTVPLLAQAQTRPLNVELNGATRVQLRAPAGSVIVANPRIADVTVVDANTLFITGKGYGVTDVVVVDAIGRPLFQNQVVVSASTSGSVRVWRGAQATEVACGNTCSPSVKADPAP